MKLKVGNRNLTIRKWKGKDKKAFINSLKEENINEEDVMNALVYDSIEEENVILSSDEFKYVLSRIRAYSLGEEINVEFMCGECGEIHTQTFELKNLLKYEFKPLKEIKIPGAHIKFGEIANKELYISKIKEDEDYDFLLRISEINENNTFTLNELEMIIDDLDIDVLTEVMTIWEESKFKLDDVGLVKCPNCGDEVYYQFDEIPGFFPTSWFEEE